MAALTRLAAAVLLCVAVPAQAGWREVIADGFYGAQAGVANLLRFLTPDSDSQTPTPPQAPDFGLDANGNPADEQSVVEKLAVANQSGVNANPVSAVACQDGAADAPLSLAMVISQALCNHPQTRSTWAQARAEAARLDAARAAWQPTVQGAATYTDATYDYPGNLELPAKTVNLELRLSWVLLDFGRRSARFDNAEAVLDAANATQSATVQKVLYESAQAYFDVRAAQAQVVATRGAEAIARENLETAEARFKAGVAARIEALQAASALAQASLERVQAESAQLNAQGILAVKMGMSADAPLRLTAAGPAPTSWEPPGSVASLIAEARLHHPALRVARKQMAAASANIALARAEGLPTLSTTLSHRRNIEREETPLAGFETNNSVGLQLSIPLYEGQARQSLVRAAEAEFDVRQFEFDRIEQEISLEVWRAFNDLKSERERLETSDKLVTNARLSLDITQGRYKMGVGDILELLNAQKTYAEAQRLQIDALAKWQSARLRLATAVGRIGLWAVEGS